MVLSLGRVKRRLVRFVKDYVLACIREIRVKLFAEAHQAKAVVFFNFVSRFPFISSRFAHQAKAVVFF